MLRKLSFLRAQGFSCNPTVCFHYGHHRAAASASQRNGWCLVSLQEPPWVTAIAPGSVPWRGPVCYLQIGT